MANMKRKTQTRNGQLAAIHVLKGQLGLERTDYEDLVEKADRETRRLGPDDVAHRSSSKLTGPGRAALLDQLRWMAGEAPRKRKARRGDQMGFRDEDEPRLKKMRMMWLALAEAGAVEAATEAALNAWVRKQRLGADHVNWLDGAGLNKAIEQLKEWHRRVGIAE